MYTTIRDPGIRQGFSILADVFGAPNAQQMIQADLARHQRDDLAAQTALRQQELQAAREQHANQVLLQSILAGNPDFADPAGRADFMSAIAGAPGGMQHGPRFATGSATFIDPQFADDSDFSRILTGTGVAGYDQTPDGVAAGHERALQQQQMQNAAAMERQLVQGETQLLRQQMQNEGARELEAFKADLGVGGSGTPMRVSPQDAQRAWETIEEQLLSTHGAREVDPAARNAIMARFADEYQRTRNFELAAQSALEGLPLEREDNPGLIPGLFGGRGGGRVVLGQGQPPAGRMLPADNPAAGGAPAPAAGQDIPDGTRGRTKDGRVVERRNGQWVVVE